MRAYQIKNKGARGWLGLQRGGVSERRGWGKKWVKERRGRGVSECRKQRRFVQNSNTQQRGAHLASRGGQGTVGSTITKYQIVALSIHTS
jgi:hypothetical protein